jgi:hypothetical protein
MVKVSRILGVVVSAVVRGEILDKWREFGLRRNFRNIGRLDSQSGITWTEETSMGRRAIARERDARANT